jgi:hypothetical protein
MSEEYSLSDRMRATGKPELIMLANNLDEATSGVYGDPQTCSVKTFLGCWARARRAWCEYSGEPLI